jgi:uncharacterized secreted repeat protein (TIGR03808 family)
MTLTRRNLLTATTVAVVNAPLKVAAANSDIAKALAAGGLVRLPAGTFDVAGLEIAAPLVIEGVAGQTKLVSHSGGPIFTISNCADVNISGIHFMGKAKGGVAEDALVVAKTVKNLNIQNCTFSNSAQSGIGLFACSGRVNANHFENFGDTALVALDSTGLEISSNVISHIGNNGIQVWRSENGEDGTQILHNRISHVRFDKGGDGEYGNAIIVYRAGNVIAAHNRVSDLAYTGIRFNSSHNGQIIGNNISRTGEKAIYAEFSFEGMVIANNVVDDAGFGISITNFDVGGRMAVCTGNLVRNVRRGKTISADVAWGISAAADTLVSNNVVENVDDAGINLGWGNQCRNLVAQGNIMRGCGRGIDFSTTAGAGKMMISGNMIDGAKLAAIQGMDYFKATTDDVALPGSTAPSHVTLSNNIAFKS